MHIRVIVELEETVDQLCLGYGLVELDELTVDASLKGDPFSAPTHGISDVRVTHLVGGLQLHAHISG